MYPRWLSLKAAAQYSGLGRHRLKALARQRVIKGFQDPDSKRHDWVIDRLSLDHYREGQMTQMTVREKALAILRGDRL